MSLHKIERNLLEKAVRDFSEKFESGFENSLLESHTDRQAHFDANYKQK